jgi:hypothetical protein
MEARNGPGCGASISRPPGSFAASFARYPFLWTRRSGGSLRGLHETVMTLSYLCLPRKSIPGKKGRPQSMVQRIAWRKVWGAAFLAAALGATASAGDAGLRLSCGRQRLPERRRQRDHGNPRLGRRRRNPGDCRQPYSAAVSRRVAGLLHPAARGQRDVGAAFRPRRPRRDPRRTPGRDPGAYERGEGGRPGTAPPPLDPVARETLIRSDQARIGER